MLISSWLSSLQSTLQRRSRTTTRRSRKLASSQHVASESLEVRALLAAFGTSGTQLNLDLNVANQSVSVAATATEYKLTLNSGSWSGTTNGNVSVSGATLTVTTAGLAAFDTLNITDSAAGAGVTFANSGTNAYSDNINVTLDSGPTAAVQFNGTTRLTGSSSIDVTTTRDIVVSSNLTTVDGNITLSANQQAIPSAGYFNGVAVYAVIQATGSGSVTVQGSGAGPNPNTGDVFYRDGSNGVLINTGGKITSGAGGGNVSVIGHGAIQAGRGVVVGAGLISAGGMGSVTVVGYGGANGTPLGTQSDMNGSSVGVQVSGSVDGTQGITSSGGSVAVTGYGAGSATGAASNHGVAIGGGGGGGLISAGGNGNVTIVGYGGAGLGGQSSNQNNGVHLSPGLITSNGGNVSVTGTAGQPGNYGRWGVSNAVGQITAGGNGNVNIVGFGSPDGLGNGGGLAQNNGSITSSGGNVSVTGVGSGTGLGMLWYSSLITTAANGGNVTMIYDTGNFFNGSNIKSNFTSTFTRRQYTDGFAFDTGFGGTQMDLSFNTLIFGDSHSGNLTAGVSGQATPRNVELNSGANIFLQGVNTSGGSLKLTSGASANGVQPVQGSGNGNDVSTIGNTTSFGAGSNLRINIGANNLYFTSFDSSLFTPSGGYDQLGATGTVDLSGVGLSLTGSYTPGVGDVFTIVSAQSVTGTFNGLPNNAITIFNGMALRVNYTATTVTLTYVGVPPTVTTPTSTSIAATTAILGGNVTKAGLGSSAGTPATLNMRNPGDVAFDASGNLYITSQYQYDYSVKKFAPGATTPSATLTGLNNPFALTFDGTGNLYVANLGNGTVSKFAPGATTPSATLTGLNYPYKMVFDGSGNLYVSNYFAATVSKFAAASLAGLSSGTLAPSATLTGLLAPQDLDFDGSGNLYVANSNGTTVSKFFAANLAALASGSLAPNATLTGLSNPTGLGFDGSGNLYVANYAQGNGTTVSKFAPGATTPTTAVRLSGGAPIDVAFDSSGNMYVPNSGGVVSIFAPGAAGTRISPNVILTGLVNPREMAFDGNGNLYIPNHQWDVNYVSKFSISTPPITQRGIVYAPTSVNASPKLGGTGVIQVNDPANTTGVFSDAVSGLQIGTGYSFAAFATNSQGTVYSSVATFTTISNTAPSVTANIAAVVNEGGTASNTGTYSDAQGNNTVSLTSIVKDGLGNVVLDAQNNPFTGTVTKDANGNGTWTWSASAIDGPAGPFTVTITATDNQAAASTTTFTYSVSNVVPTITLSGETEVNEGWEFTLNLGSVFDPGQDTITSYTINWGDLTSTDYTGSPGSVNHQTATHTYADGPADQVNKITVTDEDGTFLLAGSLTVKVLNVAPTAMLQSDSIIYGNSATASLRDIFDPSTVDTAAGLRYAFSLDTDTTGSATYLSSGTSDSANFGVLNAGTYTVYARIFDKDGDSNLYTTSLVVSKADADVLVSGYVGTYDAALHGATGTATGVGGVDLNAGLNLGSSFIDAPGGTAHWVFSGGVNYLDEEGYVDIVINKAIATVTVNGYSGTYDAASHGATGTATGVGGVDLGLGLNLGSSFTDAPGGTANWSFTGGTNYNDQNGTAAIVINKANATVTVNGYSGIYDASAHGATGTVVGVAGDLAASGSSLSLGSSFTNAPGGTANWSFTGGTNYIDQSGTASIVINKANATVTVNGYSGTYDASAHGATGAVVGVAGDLSASGSSLSLGSSFTDAPGGTASWSFTGGTNYNDQSGTATITINKAGQTISWSNPSAINYGTPLSGTQLNAAVTGVAGGTAAGVLTYSPSDGTVLLAGTQTLMVSAAATTNYNLATASVSLVVNPYTSTGFLQPISHNRAFKQGSTVSIKWRVNDASGNPLTSLSAIANLTVTGPGGTTQLYPGNNNSSGASVLRNDDGQYIFNWQTKGFVIGSYTISALLADGTSVTQTIMLTTSGAASGLVINGVTGTTAVGALLAGDLTLYVDNSSGGFSSDELARIDAAIAGIELLVSPYGANIFVVDGTVGLNANIVLASGTTSVLGGMAEGILGVSTSDGGITIIDGWNWYAGASAGAIGSGQFDFQTVITHEIAHSIGLGHSDVNSSVMFPALATTEARRTVVFADLNTAGEEGNGSGLHAEAIYAANLNQNVASAEQDSSPLSPASNLKLAGPTAFAAATPLRSIVKELTTDRSLNVATADVTNRRDLNTGLRRAAKESAWRSAIGSTEVETLTDGQDIDSFFASLMDNDGEILDNLMDSAFNELGN